MKTPGFLLLIMFITACSTSYKELKELEEIKPKIALATQWVSPSGEKHPREYRQLPFVSAGNTVYIANVSGYVAAIDLPTGRLKWQERLSGEQLIAGPGYGEDTLVLVDNEAYVIALESSTGKQKWRQRISTEVVALPAISQGKVLVQSVDGRLTALDIHSGKLVWSEKQPIPPLTLRGSSSPLIIDDKVIAGFSNGKLVAYNLTTGKMLWELSLAIPRGRTDLERMVDIDSNIVAVGNTIYAVSYQGRIASISASNGHINWSRDMSSYSGLTVQGDKVYLTDAKGYVWALDVSTGATVWRQESLLDRELSAPVAMGKTVVVGDITGNVHWLSQDDGDFLARLNLQQVYLSAFVDWGDEPLDELDYAVTAAPVVTENRLLVRDNAGSLSLFEIVTPGDDKQ